MADPRQATGRKAEIAARDYLEAKGYRVRDANWRHRFGELDLILLSGDTLVCVEVRSHRSRCFGTPEESITTAKQRRLVRLAQSYVQAAGWQGPWRIDVVAVTFDQSAAARVTHYENAVGG